MIEQSNNQKSTTELIIWQSFFWTVTQILIFPFVLSGREPSVRASATGESSVKPVRITVPPQMLPHSRIPPPPPPSSSLDRGRLGQPVAMTTFKAPSSLSYSPKGLRSIESELSEHSQGGPRNPLLSIPESAQSTHGAPFLEYATDVWGTAIVNGNCYIHSLCWAITATKAIKELVALTTRSCLTAMEFYH